MTTTTFPRIPGHRRCCEILGNGDFRAGKELIQQLAHRLEHARAKHPWPAHAPGNHGALANALGRLTDERFVFLTSGEVVDEMNRGDDARRRDELLDVLAVAWRWVNDEHESRRKKRLNS